MKFTVHTATACSVAVLSASVLSFSVLCASLAHAEVDNTSAVEEKGMLEVVHVYGEPDKTRTATRLDLTIFETPQVMSVISRDQIEDFSLRDVNTLLKYVPGVTVERVETGRTYYTARGFDIVNFQYDGVGAPFSYGLTQGDDDSAIYEQVEVVKGATGLITGLANPSATVNYVRKRPTDTFEASATAAVGSWSNRRIDADVSGPLTEKLQGRLVVADENSDSYLDRFSRERTVFYGILAADLTDTTRLTVGHSINDDNTDGASSGALPLFYSNGALTDYDVSTNTATDWSMRDMKQTRSFVELEQQLGNEWTAKAIFTFNRKEQETETFYLSGAPDPIDETGMVAVAAYYAADDKEKIGDLYISGSFSLGGREHDLVAGINRADIDLNAYSVYSSAWGGYDDPIGGDWAQGSTPRPVYDLYDMANQSTDIDQQQTSYYISTRLHLSDNMTLLLGGRTVDIEQKGISYGAPQTVSEQETVPYVGVTYEVITGTMLYASYSEVFSAQTWVDANLLPLGPVRGEGAELGVKQELFAGAAVLTMAMFESRQENFGEWVSRDIGTGLNIYRGVELESEGFEVELSGQIIDGLNISMGYTDLSMEDQNGADIRTYIPTRQFKLAAGYSVPSISGLRLGGGVNWQNEIYYGTTEVEGAYALVDLFAHYDVTSNLTLAVNINNVGDKKYRESPQWGQANYGAPRNVMGSITWRY